MDNQDQLNARTFEVNISANLEAMSSDSKFSDVKEGEIKIWRFAPPVREDGLIFYMAFNHYKLKNPDEPDRTIALADLEYHGTPETGTEDYLARLAKVLLDSNKESEKKIGRDIKGNRRYYAQAWEGTPVSENKFKWSKLKLASLPKTGAQEVLKILKNQQKLNQPLATDVEKGQSILVSREGTGFNTKYSAERSGVQENLNEIRPDWEDELYDDVYAVLDLRIYTPEEQKRIAQFTFPDLDWEKLEREHGL
jgi:hypothetical protein